MVMITKAIFGVALAVALGLMWNNRQAVIEPYTDTDSAIAAIQLKGLDTDFERAQIEASPYDIAEAPDTRAVPMLALARDSVGGVAPVLPFDQQVEMTGGDMTLGGSVTDGVGNIGGAIVRVERHTVDGVGRIDLRANSEGFWGADGLPGGRYRVRAWHPRTHASLDSKVFFAEDGEAVRLAILVQPVQTALTVELVHRGRVYKGLSGTVAVVVTNEAVDADGIATAGGVANLRVNLTPSGGVTLAPGAAITDVDGVARFRMTCHQLGQFSAVATIGVEARPFALPPCQPAPPAQTIVVQPPAPTPAPAPTLAPTTPTNNAPGSGASTGADSTGSGGPTNG